MGWSNQRHRALNDASVRTRSFSEQGPAVKSKGNNMESGSHDSLSTYTVLVFPRQKDGRSSANYHCYQMHCAPYCYQGAGEQVAKLPDI